MGSDQRPTVAGWLSKCYVISSTQQEEADLFTILLPIIHSVRLYEMRMRICSNHLQILYRSKQDTFSASSEKRVRILRFYRSRFCALVFWGKTKTIFVIVCSSQVVLTTPSVDAGT